MKRRPLELFVLGIPIYRKRFRVLASAPTIECFYRLIRACCVHVEELREPFEGAIECDEITIGVGIYVGKNVIFNLLPDLHFAEK